MKINSAEVLCGISLPNGDSIVCIEWGSSRADWVNCNVYRINGCGDVVWKIDAPRSKMEGPVPFVGIKKLDNSKVLVQRWDDQQHEVSIETGLAGPGQFKRN